MLHAHETFLRDEPGEVSTVVVIGRVPHVDFFPQDTHGTPFVAVLGMHAGSVDEGMDAMRPLRELVEPIIDLSGPMPYVEVQQIYDADYPGGMRYYWKSTSLMSLSDEVVDILVKYAELAPSDHSTIDIWYSGGAIADHGEEATAFGRRDIPYLINPEANWEDAADDEVNIAWARNFLKDLKPYSEAHLYLNFSGFLEEGDELMKAAFGGNYRRLVELKNKYDPQNLFKMNHNIKPEST